MVGYLSGTLVRLFLIVCANTLSQEEQAPCQYLRSLLVRRKLLVYSEIEEGVRSDAPWGAKGMLPAGGHTARGLAPPAVWTRGSKG